jgi:drug/metabolite transporter (DMT)-like permease
MPGVYRWIVLALLWLVWGTSWPAMRAVFVEVPVWQFRALSCFFGGLALLLWAKLAGGAVAVPRAQWGPLAVSAFFNMTLWHICVGYGLARIGAGQGAVLAYTMPIWTALLGALVLKEPFTRRIGLALMLGMAGVGVLVSGSFSALQSSPAGIAFLLVAALGWAVGTVILKREAWSIGMTALAGWQLLIGVVPIGLVAVLAERFTMHEASEEALLAAAYVTFIAITAGYALWYRVVNLFPATVGAIGTLVIPCVGVASGSLLLGEVVGWRELVALGLVLAALVIVCFAPPAKPAD